MQFPAEIASTSVTKKTCKITLLIDDQHREAVMQNLHNFIDRPINVNITIDADKRLAQLNTISDDQRKKIYALIHDIAAWMGETEQNAKAILKSDFCLNNETQDFSLSDCSKDDASKFIEYLLDQAIENGIQLTDKPTDYLDDIETYVRMCIKHRKCVVCGQEAELHHCEGSRVGMGNDRRKISNEGKAMIALCRKHHSELHNMSEQEFMQKYHVCGVKM